MTNGTDHGRRTITLHHTIFLGWYPSPYIGHGRSTRYGWYTAVVRYVGSGGGGTTTIVVVAVVVDRMIPRFYYHNIGRYPNGWWEMCCGYQWLVDRRIRSVMMMMMSR
jgi:hypothetical protein